MTSTAIDQRPVNQTPAATVAATAEPAAAVPHVVILGAGFAGLAAARALGNQPVRVTLVDRRNYHLFVPLLYQVATAALSPAEIAQPVRRLVSRYRNIEVVMADIVGIDTTARQVLDAGGGMLTYDVLVVATGASLSYFGHPEWAALAPGLKSAEDARAIRTRLLLNFERAETTADPVEQQRLMTVVVVGGGPTGVELAGAIAELTRHTLVRDFRRIRPDHARILLVEMAPRLLTAFPQRLSDYARTALTRLGVEVRLGVAVQAVTGQGVTLAPAGGGAEPEAVPAGLTVWGAGVAASPAGRWLGVETDRAGRVKVGPDLAVPGLTNVYALGDVALALDANGKPLPGLAQVAKQQGEYLGRALRDRLVHGRAPAPFRFRDRGNLATVGRNAAVADFGWTRLTGWLAWALWGVVHIYLLNGFENRLLVSLQWLGAYLTFHRGARLIMADPGAAAPPRPTAPVNADSAGALSATPR